MKPYFKPLLLVGMLLFSALALADPPGRVGQIAYTHGIVSFRASYDDDPVAAELNWPVTSQNVLSTASGARTELRIGSTAVRLDSNSELEITQLDDQHLKLYLTQGSASIRVTSRDSARDFELETPQGLVLLTAPSELRVDAGRQPETTAISLFSGAARFQGAGSDFSLRAGNRMEIASGNIRMSDAHAGDYADEFDHWSAARDQRDDASVSARYLSPEMTGYEELDRNGTWSTTEAYGAVWYPTVVPVDWAPYRAGRWTWIEPWGWTWVDSAPWGYAPSHYGRWVSLHRRWCWVPGARAVRPIWAPALVGWVGGRNWNVAFSVGSAPAVGWFPLAPREVYLPSYRVSPTYVRQINIAHVTNINNITNITNLARHTDYQNSRIRDAVTVMPQDHFVVHKTVVVAPSQAVLRQPQQLKAAPVSALVPTAIARPNVLAAPNPARAQRQREWERAPRTLSNLPQQRQQQRQQERQPAVVVAAPTAAAPAANSRATAIQPGSARGGMPVRPERQAAPLQAAPSTPAVTSGGPREREFKRTPMPIERAERPLQPRPSQPAQPIKVEPLVVQPVPARGTGAGQARARVPERHDNPAARVERRELAPLSPLRNERHETVPVPVERRAIAPPQAPPERRVAPRPAASPTPAAAARGPEAARERRGHERDGQHPSASGEASGPRSHQAGMER